MNSVTLAAFRDEMEKIAFTKKAGLLRDVGQNIGNTLKGFVTPVSAMKKGIDATIYSVNPTTKVVSHSRMMPLLTGAFTGMEVPKLFKKEDPAAPGVSRTERVGRMLGSQAGMLIGMPHGLSGSIAGSVAGSYLGGKAGKATKKRLARKQALKDSMMSSTGAETPGFNPNKGPQF